MEKPVELKMSFNGVSILFNDKQIINDRIEVKISYLTALIFIDGKHEISYYLQSLSVGELAGFIVEDFERKVDITLAVDEAMAIATYIKGKI